MAPRVAVALAASVLFVTPALLATQNTSRDASTRPLPVQEVSSLNGLRARTADERKRAEYFVGGAQNIVETFRLGRPFYPPDNENMIAQGVPVSADDALRQAICRFDGIFVGSPRSSKALLSHDDTVLFTDYRIEVSRWIRADSMPAEVTATLEGGEVKVAGRLLSVPRQPRPRLNDRYIFYGQLIVGTSGYRVWKLESLGRQVPNGLNSTPPQATEASLANLERVATSC